MFLVKLEEGDKVVRGPDWEYDEQDGGAGGIGTVREVIYEDLDFFEYNIVVEWDNGNIYEYTHNEDIEDVILLELTIGEKYEDAKL